MTQKLFHDLSMLITLPCCLCPHGLTFSVTEPADQLSQNLVMSLEIIKIPYYNFHTLSTFIFLCDEHMSLHCLKFMDVATYKVTNAVQRTLFCLGCTRGTWVAEGTHHTSV